MSFTIQVSSKNADEEFTILDMELLHKECCGGKIKVSGGRYLSLECQRCFATESCYANHAAYATKIITTAVDGKPRELDTLVSVERLKVGQGG